MLKTNNKDYMNFKKELVETLNNDMELSTYKIVFEDVYKNNTKLDGVRFFKQHMDITPVFYIDDFYDDYVDEVASVYTIVKLIKDVLNDCAMKNTMQEKKKELFNLFKDKDALLKNVEFCVRNKCGNEHLVKNIPTRNYLDLIIYYQIALYDDDTKESMSVKVTNDMTKQLNITESELFNHALYNLDNGNNFAMSMFEMIKSIYGMPFERTCSKDDEMIVICNEKGLNGSNNILNIILLDEIANTVDSDLYILPSSIHELIVVPIKDKDDISCDTDFLKNMVSDVNCTNVDAKDKLCDSVYKYTRNNRAISLV